MRAARAAIPRPRCLFAATAVLALVPAWSAVPPALQDVRRHMLDADVNALTFHDMAQIFDTSRVPAGSKVWQLPRAEVKPDFAYQFDGKTYTAEDGLERTYTNALLVIKHGTIVTEIYRNKTNASTHFISFSMAKSITSILIGDAIADHYIHSIDDQITRYIPELKGTGYDGVTIREALRMRSGVDYDERYDFSHPSLAAAMFEESLVENRIRFAAFAKIVGRAYPPGTHFNYSTLETEVLGWVLRRATKQSISQYMTERLWKPAGMESYGFWIMDGPPPVGREFNGAGFNAVLRDYGRIGLMMLRGGKANGKQVVPQEWVRKSTDARDTTPLEPGMPLGYQYQWWTIAGTDAYTAIGLQGQFIFVDPDTDTVVVKLSYFPPGNMDADRESIAFLQAASKWNGR
ncbi:MAG TPA: serine hydrolase [Steroidobacteraceae bacterium]|nr:serine hydrolase [Steroidobacteraceae bacterium]